MPRGRIGGGLSISDLESMIALRRSQIAKLQKQRAPLERKLTKLNRQIEALGGESSAGRMRAGGRARNTMSLSALITQTLGKAGKPMQVGDIVDKVLAAGYRTKSGNFRGIVNQTLIKDKQFASAGRGLYQLKK